ncbi:MAG: glycosyltransferase, partial [Acidimicrobiales bacterium]
SRFGRQTRAMLPVYPFVFSRLRLRGYDVVLSSTSGWAHATVAVDGVHVAYCNNPPRWIHDRERYFGEGGPVPSLARPAVRAAMDGLARWDRWAATHPDVYIASSRAVSRRIVRAYGRQPVAVIHPPVELDRFPDGPIGEPGDYALVVSRLLPYKRVDLAIAACEQLGVRLVVVGKGPADPGLRRLAGAWTEFRSSVSDDELRALISGCRLMIQAGDEDFGLAPLDANAAGRPAVAFAAGGALETVVDGETGVLFAEPSVASLADALRRAQNRTWDPAGLRRHAESFGEARFHRELLQVIEEARR